MRDFAELQTFEVEVMLEEAFEYASENWRDELNCPSSWSDIKWNDGGPWTVNPLGLIKYVDDYGGEGQGDEYWVVFSITNNDKTRYFKKEGGYASYVGGGELDGDLQEVFPKEKVITVWQ